MQIKKSAVIRLLYVFIAVSLILSSASIFTAIPGYENISSILLITVLGIMILLLYMINRALSKKNLIVLSLFLFLVIPYVFFCGLESMQSIFILILSFPMCSLLISHLERYQGREIFFKILISIICCIGLISLFFWLFGSTLQIIRPTDIISYGWTGETKRVNTYLYLYFEPQGTAMDFLNTESFHVAYRNCAIFSEAPMASFVFCTALLINEYICEKKSNFATIIFVVTILTTQSTTGLIVLILFFFLKIIDMSPKNKKFGVFLKIILALCCVACALYLINMALNKKMETSSGFVRMSLMMNEFEAFMQSPLIGNGFNQYTKGSSNSITALLADGGVFLWGIYYIPLFGNIIFQLIFEKKLNRFAFLFTVMFAITVSQYTIMTVFIILLFWEQFIRLINKKVRFDWHNNYADS